MQLYQAITANAKRKAPGNYDTEVGKIERCRILQHWQILNISPWRDGEPWEGLSVAADSSGWGRQGVGQLWHSWDETSQISRSPHPSGIPPGIDTKHSLQMRGDKDTKPGGDVPFPAWQWQLCAGYSKYLQARRSSPAHAAEANTSAFPGLKALQNKSSPGSSAKHRSAQTTAISTAKFKCKSRLELLKNETKERAGPGEAWAQSSSRLRSANTLAPVGWQRIFRTRPWVPSLDCNAGIWIATPPSETSAAS